MKRFASLLLLALVLLVSCTAGGDGANTPDLPSDTTPDTVTPEDNERPEDLEPEREYTFGIFADIHSSSTYFDRTVNNIFALTDEGKSLDGMVLIGDILYTSDTATPNYGFMTSNDRFMGLLSEGKVVYAMGNHEFPLWKTDEATTTASKALFESTFGLETDSDTVWGGYHFIAVAPDNYAGAVSREREEWIMERIDAALAESDSKPVFLFIHHPIDGTIYGSASANRHSEEFENYIKGIPRLIVISGHNHYTNSDPHSIYQVEGGTTFLYTSVVYTSVGQSMSWASQEHRNFSSQALILKVNNKTNKVTVKRFYVDPEEPTWLEGGDWVLDIPAMMKEEDKTYPSTEVYRYTEARAKTSVPPAFAKGAEISVDDLTPTSATISFPNAVAGANDENSFVAYYKIEIADADSGEVICTDRIISDFFIKNKRERVTHSVFGTKNAKTWRITVTPVTTWYVEGTPITVEVSPPAPEFPEVEYDNENVLEASVPDIKTVGIGGHFSRNEECITVVAKGSCTMRYTFNVTTPGTYRVIALAAASGNTETTLTLDYQAESGSVSVLNTKETIGTGETDYPSEVTLEEIELKEAGEYVMKLKKANTATPLKVWGFILAKIAD